MHELEVLLRTRTLRERNLIEILNHRAQLRTWKTTGPKQFYN